MEYNELWQPNSPLYSVDFQYIKNGKVFYTSLVCGLNFTSIQLIQDVYEFLEKKKFTRRSLAQAFVCGIFLLLFFVFEFHISPRKEQRFSTNVFFGIRPSEIFARKEITYTDCKYEEFETYSNNTGAKRIEDLLNVQRAK